MERLTYEYNGSVQVRGADCNTCKEVCDAPGRESCTDCPIDNAMRRLKAYEDSGLTPEQVTILAKGQIERFTQILVETVPQLLQAIIERLPELVTQAINETAAEIQEGTP